MLNPRHIIEISKSIDGDTPVNINATDCPETAAQLRIDRLLRRSIPVESDTDADIRATRIIDSIRNQSPLHMRPRRFDVAPFIAVAAALTLAAGLTVLMSESPTAQQEVTVAQRPGLNASELVSTPFVTEARLLAEDTSRAADAVFAYLPRMRE
jgi:hypothetical protein